MNDFTKEELTAIRDECRGIYVDGNIIEPIIVKIESMIDNYCDHQYENHCCGCDLQSISCEKCGRRLA